MLFRSQNSSASQKNNVIENPVESKENFENFVDIEIPKPNDEMQSNNSIRNDDNDNRFYKFLKRSSKL